MQGVVGFPLFQYCLEIRPRCPKGPHRFNLDDVQYSDLELWRFVADGGVRAKHCGAGWGEGFGKLKHHPQT